MAEQQSTGIESDQDTGYKTWRANPGATTRLVEMPDGKYGKISKKYLPGDIREIPVIDSETGIEERDLVIELIGVAAVAAGAENASTTYYLDDVMRLTGLTEEQIENRYGATIGEMRGETPWDELSV